MLSFADWYADRHHSNSLPWLILGKGPSFSKLRNYDLSKYRLAALNHAARELPVELAHVIDIEVLTHSGEEILANSKFLVMPRVPHVNMSPGAATLEELACRHPILRTFKEQNRLLCYDLSTSSTVTGSEAPIVAKNFSVEALLELLSRSGARHVVSLGIDGGTQYAEEFDDLRGVTKLANQQESFDPQFVELCRILSQSPVKFYPLDQGPVRVFIGSHPHQHLAAALLKYSVQKHASLSVDFQLLEEFADRIPVPRAANNRNRTAFSFQRFLIPELCEYSGRALYLDSDMIVMRDLRQIWSMDAGPFDLLCINPLGPQQKFSQFAVMLLNCGKLTSWNVQRIVKGLDDGEFTYEELVHDMKISSSIGRRISPAWNCLDSYHPESSCLVHYTDMTKQPWVSRNNRAGTLWCSLLRDAITDGAISIETVEEEVRRGHVRPSLLRQIELQLDDPVKLCAADVALDSEFVPPYTLVEQTRAVVR